MQGWIAGIENIPAALEPKNMAFCIVFVLNKSQLECEMKFVKQAENIFYVLDFHPEYW